MPATDATRIALGSAHARVPGFSGRAHRNVSLNASRKDSVNAVAAPAPLEERSSPAQPGEVEFAAPPKPMSEIFDDYSKGYLSVSSDAETEGWCEVEGTIPAELTGTLLRNGPALFERKGFKKVFLDGDGMVSSIAIKDGKAYFRNKFVRTESFKREEEAGRFLDLSIFSADDPRPSYSGRPLWKHRLVDDIFRGPPAPKNNGAFNAWYWGGSLVAVDFGRPFGLDKETMDTVGDVDVFSSKRYTAHSRILREKDGSLRLCAFHPFVDYAKYKTFVNFLEFDEEGQCVQEKKFDFPAAYFHDMIVTENWYILFDCPTKMSYWRTFVKYPLGQVGLGDTLAEDKSKPPIFRLFPRRTEGKMIEIPAEDIHCYAYHHVNGFDVDEKGHKIVFDTCTWDRFTLYFKDIVEPDGKECFPRTQLTRFEIDVEKGVATHRKLNGRPCEYPAVAPEVSGRPYQHSYMSTSYYKSGDVYGPMQSLTKVSLDSEAVDAETVEENWLAGEQKFVGEPICVPKKDGTAEDDCWILILVHDSETVTTDLSILDGSKISEGPVASMKLPAYVPMGVHGSWAAEYILGPNE
ncbi:hypothetical protein BSKO_09632 [Bryopsis sp. KO-2023]|nr:hypothetical protein BSKO_09632 [Bryopsis sp. KO-2023]